MFYSTTVFFVEDSAEDRALYRRLLEQDDRNTYDICEFESGEEALQACQGKIPDVILLDYQLPDWNGLEFLTQLQRQTQGCQISVIMLTGQGDETIAVQAMKNGAQDYLVKGKLTRDSLCRAIHGAIKQMQLIHQIEQQQEQQRLVGAIALHIRQSLQLQDILNSSVQEVRQLLKADRALIYQLTPQMRGGVVAESTLPEWIAVLELEIEDTCLQPSQREEYIHGRIWTTTNIYEAGLSKCHIQLLERFQVKASLIVPILLKNKGTPALELWGLFIVHQCSAPREWQTFEVELLKQLTVQLAIAIQQAELYNNLQTLNAELEAKVQERTAALQESDRRFRAIFNNTFQFTGLLTPDGILLEANQTALSFGGLKLEDVVNRPFWETHWWTISPQTQEQLKQAIARAAQGEFIRYEVDVIGANNRVATIDFSLRPLQNEIGQVVLLIPEGRDITQRKQTELALHEREIMLHLIGDNLSNGAVYRVIRELDGSDRFSYLSGGIEKLTQVKVEDALNDSSLLYRQFIPEDIPRLQAAVEESMGDLSVFDIQLRMQTKTGQLKWLHFRSTPRQLHDGRVAWDGLVVDVTDLKRTEETLRKSQALLEESQRVARLGNWEYELATGKITWSKGLFDLFNREPTLLEPTYEENLQLYHPEDRHKLHQSVERAIATGESYKEILRVPQPDGSNRYFEGIGHAQFNADGRVIRLYGTAQDVTEKQAALRERQTAEETLRQSEERWQLAIAGTNEAIWDWDISTDRTFRSDRWFAILGYEPNEISDGDDEWATRIHPDDYTRVMAAQEAYLSRQVGDYNVEYRLRCKDGSYRWVRSRAKAVWDEQGNPVRLVGSLGDMSHVYEELRLRKLAEDKLRHSEAQLATTQQIAHVGSWEWDIETNKRSWSKETFRIFGLNPTQSEPNLAEFIQMIHPEDRELFQTNFEGTIAQQTPFNNIEFRIVRPNGSVRYVEGRAEIAYNPQGQAVKLLGSILDITERKQTELEIIRNRDLLEAVYNESADALFLVDLATSLTTDCNQRAVNLFAASSKAELINIAGHTLQKQQFTSQEIDSINEEINQQGFWSREIEYVTKQGDCFWGNIAAKQITVAGNVMNLVRVTDITARKQAEIALRESEERLQLALEASGDGLWDWNIHTGEVYYSPRYLEMLGYTFDELPHNLSTWKQLVHPQDRAWVEEILAAHLKDSSVRYKFDYRLRTKSGEWKWVANYGKVVMRDAQGNPLRMTGTHRDISDVYEELCLRKQAEAALAKSEEQLRLTLEFNHIGTWDWNIQTNEVIWNDNHFRLLGLEPEIPTAKYQLWRNSMHPEDVGRVEQALFSALAEHINYEAEYRVIYPDGSIHWLTGKGRGVYNEAGKAVRMLGVIIDVSATKQAEVALRESEARFQAFMNNSPVLAWITDTQGRVLYLNQTYLRTFKLQPEQAIGQSIFDLYPAEIAQQHLNHIRTVNQTNQVLEVIETAWRPDDTIGEFLVYKFPILGLSTQKLVGRVAIDITERKILERELAHQQQLLNAFISSAPVGLTILDRQLHFTLVNQALAQMNGIKAAEHIGKSVWEIIPDLARKLEPIFKHVLTMGEPILDLEIDGETPKHPGMKRAWLVSCFPILSQAEQPISIGFVIVEISDRKRAQQMLELQAVITRNIAEGICLIRATDAIIVYANPKFEQMFGYDPGELVGHHVSIVNYGDENNTPENVSQAIMTAVFQHSEATYEVHNVKKDGTPFWCSATTSVFEHPEYGSVLVAVHQDITEHKQAEEKIKASLKEKEVLLKEIHHRVKNNLGIVSSLLQMQCRRTQDPQVAAILCDSQNRIASIALVHEKLYRSEDLADIDFAQYIPDLTTHLFDSYNVSPSQIKLKIQVDNASLDIETAIPCGLIINELVSNALKYAFVGNREGEIEVKFYQEAECSLILIIRDNGIGLPENFDTKKVKTLGITLVQGLVKQLRGKLEIECHQGTQFKISFTNSRA
ncbi:MULTISPECIES: PAS domain-containing protein [Nostoc]|uniref:histidine kinase n=1 Tax=Nostoc paludosum FACHB-159 TaxID=2692908 RepID=A0ABR8K7Y5_9NOSO|nr:MULTISPECIES: PAS domain-containing protein [Nostoc]MBD2679210.1 PAS domain-containing protein [Nostoc sp. FACHB-857]MBD2735591.1 PAS domain-containing protein [Nostoc paludosum FACHB-159]